MILRWLVILCLLPCPTLAAADKPLLITSNRPLAMLVEAVAGSALDVQVLLPAAGGAHHPALRMSDRRALEQAELLVWLGPKLEPGFAPIASLLDSQRQVDLSKAVSEQVPEALAYDPHLWLNPDYAVQFIALLEKTLVSWGVLEATTTSANAASLVQAVNGLGKTYRQQFTTLPDPAFVAAHDAFGHFAGYFSLQALGHFIDAQDSPIGPRSRWQLQQSVGAYQHICLLSMPQYREVTAQAVASSPEYVAVELDVLASGGDASEQGFVEYLAALLAAVRGCLAVNMPAAPSAE